MYKWQVENLKFQIGKLIQVYRLRKELSQFQLGLELNISKDHVGRIERGLTNPTIENIVKLCNFLDINILFLFTKLDITELKKIELEIDHLQKEFKNKNKRKS
ncbi:MULTISPECIES: helix-turn-helix domain-containing protein [Chryseobacterium]|jgi:transcriptional regulator with XRE-family HTH domain|uniref:Helix-turn-helix n=4 Tax=Chryseobacterium TaxID=59732 RepID=A0A1M5GWR5_9FLAO|nr:MULTISPECIES: helix-turn-helix transcriptional regulator [Chryseobacterium]EFK35739.1 DNA-binding helix-turn-helix protein [Chryseobacterium gleum ATCC 35910]QQY31476.1 helix-turn-helix transcriptional regulator [Chryseobacterium gleum]SHG08159.1 Helix-turn-helix [Chryseobacterium vrystaatense]SMO42056.1 Helix-turn-helix [Chryseobacterium rhizoplanae]VEE11843.1 transcriptional regulator, y4mF family [Chryseobacterium gleum]